MEDYPALAAESAVNHSESWADFENEGAFAVTAGANARRSFAARCCPIRQERRRHGRCGREAGGGNKTGSAPCCG